MVIIEQQTRGWGPFPNNRYIKQVIGITDEEGLRLAYEAKYGVYQHYNKLVVAGTKDPIDMVDD